MSSQPEEVGRRVVIRRRRTSRHRRNRAIRRTLLVVACAVVVATCSSVALHFLSPSLFRASRVLTPRQRIEQAIQSLPIDAATKALPPVANREVYPYSIVPGGVKDVQELKWAADHDPVVREHYAGFDYDHARIVRLVLARTVYVSYRIGNKVYWTRHRVSLKKGETLITDGKITGRTKCANRVEEVPQQATSRSEPPAAKFEEPVQPSTGTAISTPPVPFESSLLNRTAPPGLGPAPPLSLYDPLTSGTGIPLAPPPLPQVCGIGVKKPTRDPKTGITIFGTGKNKKKPTLDPCETGGGGTEVPEPGTWLLFGSGLSAIYWKARQKFARK